MNLRAHAFVEAAAFVFKVNKAIAICLHVCESTLIWNSLFAAPSNPVQKPSLQRHYYCAGKYIIFYKQYGTWVTIKAYILKCLNGPSSCFIPINSWRITKCFKSFQLTYARRYALLQSTLEICSENCILHKFIFYIACLRRLQCLK